MKKVLAIVMALALLSTCMVFVSADADVTATVATLDGPFSAGDEIAIPVTITEWTNAYATISVSMPEYDETLLTFDGFDGGSDFSGALNSSGGNGFGLIASPSSDREANKLKSGEVCVMYFYAATDIEVSTTVSVVVTAHGYSQGSADNWVTYHALNVETVNGGIYVEGSEECTHEGGTATCNAKAVCTLCGEEYGDVNANNHAGETEVRNAAAASCYQEGYTGDTYCLGCDTKIADGETIPATGNHVGAGDIQYDETDHWYNCGTVGCGNLVEKSSHTGGTATCNAKAECSVCGAEYGDFNATNHAGGTETRNDVAADCGNAGYTGDTYCLGCDTKIADGETISATGNHTGGTATCNAKAQCSVCGQEYGNLNANNHVGGTEVRNQSETYTGDTYCLGCDTLLANGTAIEPVKADVTATVATLEGPFAEGDEIAISVNITEWANAYATIDVSMPEYDETLLTFDGYDDGADFSGALASSGSKGFGLVAAPSSSREANKLLSGEVCIMYFYAVTDINVSTTVSVVVTANGYTSGSGDNWVENHALTVETINGGIYVPVEDHDCTPSGDIQYDATNHWYVCGFVGCGNLVNVAPHEGGEATCIAKGKCSVCGYEYININANNHAGETEVRNAVAGDCGNDGYTGDTYCLDCGQMIEEGDVIPATGNHTGGEATCCNKAECSVCGEEYGDVNADNHVGETEVRDATEDYTGDTYCLDCGKMIAQGRPILPNTGYAIVSNASATSGETVTITVSLEGVNALGCYGATLVFDETELQLVDMQAGDFCYMVNVAEKLAFGYSATNVTSGTLFTAQFKILKESGECAVSVVFDADATANSDNIPVTMNVTAGKVTVGCAHDGETEVRNAVAGDCGNDGYTGDIWCLGCDTLIEEGTVIPATGNHTGGEATCNAKAECSVCGQEYGDVNADNHVGETEVRGAVAGDCGNDGYTGDTYCLDCGEMIEEGDVIPATGNHTGGEATCCNKAECSVCGEEYGDIDADNHKNTEVRNASAFYSGDTYCLDCGEMVKEGTVLKLLGDADSSDSVTVIDAMLVAQYSARMGVTVDIEASDVDGDGAVTIIDAMLIAQYSAKLINQFPAEQ